MAGVARLVSRGPVESRSAAAGKNDCSRSGIDCRSVAVCEEPGECTRFRRRPEPKGPVFAASLGNVNLSAPNLNAQVAKRPADMIGRSRRLGASANGRDRAQAQQQSKPARQSQPCHPRLRQGHCTPWHQYLTQYYAKVRKSWTAKWRRNSAPSLSRFPICAIVVS